VVKNDETGAHSERWGQFVVFFILSSCDLLLHQLLNLNDNIMDVDSKMEYPQEKLSIAVLGCG
jgi:hypothetical protein